MLFTQPIRCVSASALAHRFRASQYSQNVHYLCNLLDFLDPATRAVNTIQEARQQSRNRKLEKLYRVVRKRYVAR
jgi:hypothetical protein